VSRRHWRLGALAAAGVALGLAALPWSRAEKLAGAVEARRAAAIYPDYSGVTIPPNIAPLNLSVLEPGRKFAVRISGASGAVVEVFRASRDIRIPPRGWRALLEASRGGEIRLDIYAKADAGWTHFETIRNRVAAEPIDPYVVYRYLPPVYDKWDRISLRQRALGGFEERVVFDNQRSLDRAGSSAGSACFNCHTFFERGTRRMLLHVRPSQSSQIPAMILVRDGRAEKVDTRTPGKGAAAYIAWHPGGNLLAFSRNSLVQLFHTAGVETREVVDRDSDLGLYAVDTGKAFTVPQISRPDRLETFPKWAPDGRYLYFSSAPVPAGDKQKPALRYDQIRYDIARVSYVAASGRWGEPETVVSAAALGRSASLADISPDGRWLIFCGHDYGSFPVFQPGSDLYLVDLGSAGAPARRLDEVNSPRADSYHSWSSNGRWLIFASKREDGVFGRLYITHFEDGGRFTKPFVLPQEDPGFNGRCLMTFNRPELVTEPVSVSAAELTRAMNAPAAAPVAGAGTGAPGDAPWQPFR
jgi:Tol biopolymer transport system component